MATLFVSDLHLAAARPRACAQFEAFLAGPALASSRIFILGDLFEYWAGDDDLDDPFNRRIIAALSAATRRVPVAFMRGNRDFLAGDGFARATGVTLIDDPAVTDLDGRRALLLHGDTLCTGDADYQRFRAECRAPAWIAAMLARPLAERKRHIESLRAQSELQKRGKTAGIMDVGTEAVAAAFRTAGCELMIHGHTHRPGCHEIMLEGRRHERRVLDAWYECGSYLHCDAGGCRSVALP
jgi:UDP-2,3-diacylglucosamine hydrolase